MLRGRLPRAVSRRRKTEPQLPLLLKKGGPQLHPEQRRLRAKGSPGRGKEPLIPVTPAGGNIEGEEAPAASNDEVEEIQGRPHDGRQHVYVWRQRGDHFIGHEEPAETEESARVERVAKRLVDEVKVGGLVFLQSVYILFFVCFTIHVILAGRNENGEVPKKVL